MKAITVTTQAAGVADMKLAERPDPRAAISDPIVQVLAMHDSMQNAGGTRGVRGTPGFYLNGKFVDTSYGLHHLRDEVHAALAQVKGRWRT